MTNLLDEFREKDKQTLDELMRRQPDMLKADDFRRLIEALRRDRARFVRDGGDGSEPQTDEAEEGK